jgi:hypothetical protein
MQSQKVIGDRGGKEGNSPIVKTTMDAKEDDYGRITQRITRALTGATKD